MRINDHIAGIWIIALLLGGLTISGCSASRKAMKTKPEKTAVSSVNNKTALSSEMILSHLKANRIDFRTFSARVKLDITTGQTTQKGITAFVRMQKDSIIWISIRPLLGIELERVLITPDSVKLINYLKKTVYLQSADSLQQFLDIPFDFATLQDILAGNPVLITDSLQNIERDSATVSFSCSKENLSASYVLSARSFLMQESRLLDRYKRRSSQQQYDQYEFLAGHPFALQRKLLFEAGTEINATLRFSNVEFDRPLSFPFTYNDQFDIQ